MRKGKLGVVVCLYPILGFVCVILNQPLLCALILGFVLVAERDEWAGRQTLQALGLSAITAVVVHVLHYIGSLFPSYYSGFFAFLSGAFSVLSMLVYLAAILISIMAIVRLSRDREADLPGLSGLAYRAYGKQKPRPMPGQYPPPYGVQPPYAHPYQQPGQPYPPQPGPYQQPPQAPQQPQPPVPPQNGPQQPGGPQL